LRFSQILFAFFSNLYLSLHSKTTVKNKLKIQKMKIKKWVLERIRANGKIKRELIYQLEISESKLYRLLRENRANGELTAMKAVQIIGNELDIPNNEILEE